MGAPVGGNLARGAERLIMRRWLRVCACGCARCFVRDAVEDELDEELRYHLERQIDEYRRPAAWRRARRGWPRSRRWAASSSAKRSVATCAD